MDPAAPGPLLAIVEGGGEMSLASREEAAPRPLGAREEERRTGRHRPGRKSDTWSMVVHWPGGGGQGGGDGFGSVEVCDLVKELRLDVFLL